MQRVIHTETQFAVFDENDEITSTFKTYDSALEDAFDLLHNYVDQLTEYAHDDDEPANINIRVAVHSRNVTRIYVDNQQMYEIKRCPVLVFDSALINRHSV